MRQDVFRAFCDIRQVCGNPLQIGKQFHEYKTFLHGTVKRLQPRLMAALEARCQMLDVTVHGDNLLYLVQILLT